jgi:DNA-binding MarR family transcriptional regulator
MENKDAPLPQFDECNSAALRQAARAVGQMYDQHLAQVGLRGGQFSILAALARGGPLALTPLAARVGLDRTTLNRVLKPLVRDGLVRAAASDVDRRSKLLQLSPEGERKLAEARVHWEAAQAAFEINYGVREAAQLRGMLRELRAR